MPNKTHSEVIDEVTQKVLAEVELKVVTEGLTLAQLIREGSHVSHQAHNWTDNDSAVCALSAAEAALRARL